MSVVQSKRGEGNLAVITKARELATYTIHICSNEKNFPKRYRWCITNDIVKDAVEIHRNLRKANAIYVSVKSDYELRRRYQNVALASIDGLLGDMDIAYMLFNVDDNRIEHWTGLIIEVQRLLRNWKNKDYERYKALK